MRIDLNHKYNESDIVVSDKLTSLGLTLKEIAVENRDWQKAAPGPSKYQSVGYRIKTNAQTIIINMLMIPEKIIMIVISLIITSLMRLNQIG